MFTLISFVLAFLLCGVSFYFHNRLNFSKHVYYEIVNEKQYEKMFEDSSIEQMLENGCVVAHTEYAVPFFYTLHRIMLLLGIVCFVLCFVSIVVNLFL